MSFGCSPLRNAIAMSMARAIVASSLPSAGMGAGNKESCGILLHISLSRSHVGDELISSIYRTLSTSGVGMTSGVLVLFLDVRLAFVHTVVDGLFIFLFFGAILENRNKQQ